LHLVFERAMTKPQDFLLALSQNRDSASRVSLCYGL
jgi:hypothetical protein